MPHDLRRSATIGRAWVLAATFFWGTTATLARFVFRDRHVPPAHAVALRLLLATSVLAAWLAWRRPGALRIERRDIGYFVILGLFGLAAVQGSYYFAIAALGVGLAILIQYLAPSMLVIWDALRGAPTPAATAAGVVAALAGTALLIGDVDLRTVRATPLQWAVGFSSALSFAFYIVWSKRGLARYAPETVMVASFLVAAVVWNVISPPWEILGAGYGLDLWLMFAALGLFSTLVPFLCFNLGLRRLPATEAGVLSTMEPVVAVISAALFLGEGLKPLQNLGAVLVLVAAIVASRRPVSARPDPNLAGRRE